MNPAALSAALHGNFANALAAGTPGGIEQQEADGQATLLASASLPRQISGATREQLAAMGFKFGADIDDLFVQCQLPSGWTMRGTSHPLHSELFDEQGRKRAGIFYKAAFYDRRADMQLFQRYNIEPYRSGSDKDHLCCVVTDVDAVAFDAGEWKRGDFAHSYALQATCELWLVENHPGWQSPLAYW